MDLDMLGVGAEILDLQALVVPGGNRVFVNRQALVRQAVQPGDLIVVAAA